MHPLPILALSVIQGGSALDEMLRLIGIAAIVFAFFKGLKSLVAKPAAPQPAPPAALPVPPAPPPAVAAPKVASAPQPAQPAGIAPEIIAVIAAAVATALGSAHRIVAIKSQSSHWEMAGRQSVLTSHRIR